MANLISLDGGEVIISLQKTKCSFLTPLQNVLSSLFSQTTFKVTFWVCRVPTSFSAKIGHGFTYMPMCTPLLKSRNNGNNHFPLAKHMESQRAFINYYLNCARRWVNYPTTEPSRNFWSLASNGAEFAKFLLECAI